jgi:hypothetical protein
METENGKMEVVGESPRDRAIADIQTKSAKEFDRIRKRCSYSATKTTIGGNEWLANYVMEKMGAGWFVSAIIKKYGHDELIRLGQVHEHLIANSKGVV